MVMMGADFRGHPWELGGKPALLCSYEEDAHEIDLFRRLKSSVLRSVKVLSVLLFSIHCTKSLVEIWRHEIQKKLLSKHVLFFQVFRKKKVEDNLVRFVWLYH